MTQRRLRAPTRLLPQRDLEIPHIPAHHKCQWCGAERIQWDPLMDSRVAQYACGTTTFMMREDTHIDGPTLHDRRRQVAAWRAKLAAEGRPDADPFV